MQSANVLSDVFLLHNNVILILFLFKIRIRISKKFSKKNLINATV